MYVIANNLIEKIEIWPIDIECEVREIKELLDDSAACGHCYEDFMMIDLIHGYSKQHVNIKPQKLANKF